MKVVWSPEAEQALYDILDYIAQNSPDNAIRFISKLRERANELVQFPNAGRKVPELIEGNYRIFYRVKGATVEVATVFEGHRLLREEEAKSTSASAKITRYQNLRLMPSKPLPHSALR